ncbi:hypothetical protein [Microbacterium sp. No. 7]|uniref:hypothetical protein n=1 Tax=Microbacterium sp. No. 7 TaxID=1714373 RepID=UPI0006CF422B|nr:hypothetical protein [Microbacterium sp. No. 7]ALJ21927.1 glutaminase [Microbacterium sp. No. 7]
MRASDLVAQARERLRGTPRVALGDWASARRLLGFGRAPRIVPVGEAWAVGVLLVADEQLFAEGEVVRAREDAIRGYTAESQRARADRAAAAFRGGFPEGAFVHIGWQEIDLDVVDAGGPSGPLSVVGGVPHVRWSAAGGTRPLADYLDEQIALRSGGAPGA